MDITSLLIGTGTVAWVGNSLFNVLAPSSFLYKELPDLFSLKDTPEAQEAFRSALTRFETTYKNYNTAWGSKSRAMAILNYGESFGQRLKNWITAQDYTVAVKEKLENAVASKEIPQAVKNRFIGAENSVLSIMNKGSKMKIGRGGAIAARVGSTMALAAGTLTVVRGLTHSRKRKEYYNTPYVG